MVVNLDWNLVVSFNRNRWSIYAGIRWSISPFFPNNKEENIFFDIMIDDIRADTSQKGYARAMLEFLINKAKQDKNIYRIYGMISYSDEKSFDWLIPFYESVGFNINVTKTKDTYEYAIAEIILTD